MSFDVLVFGADGQLGYELCRHGGGRSVLRLTRQQCDLRDQAQLRAAIRSASPKVILNAAAYTAVDRAESEPDLAYAINATAPGVIAEEAALCKAMVVHYSTDYVFSGASAAAYVEEDTTGPVNVYGRSKLAGEEAVRLRCPQHLILRTSWVFSARGQNFVRTMLRLGAERERVRVVADQLGVPTSAAALARTTWDALSTCADADADQRTKLSGTYHTVGGPATNWHAFAKEIFLQAHRVGFPLQVKDVAAITTLEYPTPAARPRNSVLSADKLRERFGLEVRDWRDELQGVAMQIRASHTTPLESE